MPHADPAIQRLLDHEGIRETLYRYCRAIDRADEDLLRSVYWPGAIDDHAVWCGPVEDFLPFVIPVLRSRVALSHRISNHLIELHGDVAFVESYFDAYECLRGKDGRTNDITSTGRYLDRFERREGAWRIAHRKVMMDAWRIWPDSADHARGLFGKQVPMGRQDRTDPSYTLFAGQPVPVG